jgi:hypothetical protein
MFCRHCEERKRRSNPHLLCGAMDCFAEPVIGAHSRDPLARNDAHLSSLAQAGDPVRRGFSAQSLALVEYWIARLRGRRH